MHEPVTNRHALIDMEEFERRLRQSSGNQTIDDPLAELARLISGQQDLVQRVAEPQGQSSTEARQVATPSPEAQETGAKKPDALQSLGDDKMDCQDSGTVNEEIAALYIMIMAAVIIVGIVGIVASFGYRSGASPPPQIATIAENGPAKPQLEKTDRSDVPAPNTSILGATPQPSPVTVVNNVEQPVDPPRAAEIAAPSSQTAPIEPEKVNTASAERHDALISSDMPPPAIAKIAPLPVPRPAALAKAWTPARPKRPASTVAAQPTQATDSQGGRREPDALGELLRGLFGNVREP